MGKRREPRKAVQLPVRVFGTDKQGRIFSETVTTVDVSHSGAKLTGVKAQINVDEIIGLTYGKNKAHFRVKWIGQQGTAGEGLVGLLNLSPERPLWDFPLPVSVILDNFRDEPRSERRKSPRVKCSVPVEIRKEGEPTMWGKATDLGQGGCFVEMPIPLAPEARFEIALWLDGSKLRLQASVASTAPGYGIGVRFLNVAAQEKTLLAHFIQAIIPSV